ncbi:chaperone protein [Stylonychia lemnae]|uniref:Chaperone protein n=1 Tax=Stylonychia lemnae TaxID=5949 RepID=A0A078AQQ1_STYLE|nr:chaperone protein [Stylonychia lemnae]|eukprot:CDW84534.1 chaperone protein [Stylonychia lemnae]
MEKKGKIDFYGLLELEKSATTEQIKSSYKKLALRWHPDKNNNSEESNEKFKLISEAYSVLSNPQRRKHYDRFGTVEESTADDDDFFQHFSMFMGGGKSSGDDFFDHFDEFTTFLESDTKFMRKMFRDVGKDVRVKGKRRKQGGGGGSRLKDDMGMGFGMSMGMGMGMPDDIDDMLSFFMMPGLMGMPMGGMGKKNNKKKKAKKEEEDDGWNTEEEEIDDEDGVIKEKKDGDKEDEGWETVSEDDEK